jgi:hypothetical protein
VELGSIILLFYCLTDRLAASARKKDYATAEYLFATMNKLAGAKEVALFPDKATTEDARTNSDRHFKETKQEEQRSILSEFLVGG